MHQIVPGSFAGTVNFYAGDFYEKIRMYADCAVRGDAFCVFFLFAEKTGTPRVFNH